MGSLLLAAGECGPDGADGGGLIIHLGEKGKRHCLPNATIMIHRT
jgi:ATP-dependent protease ClpP protease subunit